MEIRGTRITSETGSGVCVQGGTCEIEACEIVDCKEHGVAAYDDIETGSGAVVEIRGSYIADCKGCGIQARGEDVKVDVLGSTVVQGKFCALGFSEITDKENNAS